VTTNAVADLADGTHVITARQTEPGKPESVASPAVTITVDTAMPTSDIVDVAPDPRTTGVDSIDVTFSERVYAFTGGDLRLTRTTGTNGVNLLTGSQTLTTADNVTFTLNNLGSLTSKSGGYALAISPLVGKVITDAAGNGLASPLARDAWSHSLPTWLSTSTGATWDSATKELTVTGAATLTADPGAAAPVITANGAAAVLTINPSAGRAVHVGGLNLTGGATVTLASFGAGRTAANHRVLVIDGDTLNIDATSRLDLTDNGLLFNNSGASPAAGVEAMVRAGFNGGNWLGNRITSSTANANRNFALGVVENSSLVIPFTGTRLFAGEAVDSTAVLVKFTHRADLDLDGVITSNDASIFNSRFNEGAASRWGIGDVDFDSLFTSNDASIFNSYYNESLPAV
jgi:hypothetical protein